MTQGDLLYLKTSEEPVVLIAYEHAFEHPTNKLTVRRPLMTQNGTLYELADFFRFELETPEEQDLRKIEDIKRRHKLTQLAQRETDSPQMDLNYPVDPNAPRN